MQKLEEFKKVLEDSNKYPDPTEIWAQEQKYI